LVVDPKGESARLSAKRRSAIGGKVMIVDPWGIAAVNGLPVETCTQNARFNPLDRLKADDPDLAGDVMLYADALVMSESQNPHWPNEAKALIAGFIAYIVSDPHEAQRRNLGRLRDILCLPLAQRDENGNIKDESADTLDEILGRMIASDIRLVKNSAYRFLQKEERERASVVATAQANTHFLESPRIRENLSKSDFTFADLKGDVATTVYLALPLDRMNAFGRWLRLMISTALVELTRTAENKQPHPVRFIMNEFAALGRLEAIETAFGTMAGLGVQLWAITQDLSQLKRLYGAENWQTFVANAGVFQYFGSRDYETAKYAEHLCGLSTLKKRSTSFGTNWSQGASNGGPSGSHGESETVSIDDVQRPLIFADELMRLPRDQQLLLIENLPPVMAHKWWWYRNQTTADAARAVQVEAENTSDKGEAA
jgi:type IV secretion system protein VirD4